MSQPRRWTDRIQGAFLAAFLPATLAAQGITTAALDGRLRDGDGQPVQGGVVVVVQEANGQRWQATSDAGGRYLVEHLPPGGPYTVEARAIGYGPTRRTGIALTLNRRLSLDFVLTPAAVQLEEITTLAQSPRDAGRTGPATTISDSLLARRPLLNRDVLGAVVESPQAVDGVMGISIAGQSPRHNSFQIDGGINNSPYGQFASTPGGLINLISLPGGGGLRSVPLDAVQEIQVLVAPYDVRFGSFSGGLINAVTRSGADRFQGSAFVNLQDDWLAGEDPMGQPIADFRTWQFGATASGPLIRGRLHYFLAADLQESGVPYGGPLIGTDTAGGADSAGVGIRRESAERFQQILHDTYGVDAGSYGAVNGRNPAQSLFGKLSLQLGTNHRLEISQNFVHGAEQSVLLDRIPYGEYDLTSGDSRITSKTFGTRATWTGVLGSKTFTEVTAAYLRIRDVCQPTGDFSMVVVNADAGLLGAGWKPICPGTPLAQDALQLTANGTIALGTHRLTAGTHDELLKLQDSLVFLGNGQLAFRSLNALEQGVPVEYVRLLSGPLRPEGRVADFRVQQLGAYLQDDWSPSDRVTFTLGARLDVPYFPDKPAYNPDLYADLGLDSRIFPSGNLQISPRFGFNFRPGSGRQTVLRGGIGMFSGQPAYYDAGDVYRSTGLEQFTLFCQGADVPPFTLDVTAQPTACRTGGPAPTPRVALFAPGYEFPQELRASLGLDAILPGRIGATFDLLYSRGVHVGYFNDLNLLPPTNAVTGEGGRLLYGTIDPATGFSTPARVSPRFTSVVQQRDGGETRYVSLATELRKRFGPNLELDAAYTWSSTRDVMDQVGLGVSLSGLGVAADHLNDTPLDGTLDDRRLRPSVFDVPHKLRVALSATLPGQIQLTTIYQGQSGTPFTYQTNGDQTSGDINADGFDDDPVYVPRMTAPDHDINLVTLDPSGAYVPAPPDEYARLDQFIQSEPCLRNNVGKLLPRNSCRNSWRSELDLRLSRSFATGAGRSMELIADLFNLPNFLDSDWGVVRQTTDFGLEAVGMLKLVGFDSVKDRGIYRLALPNRNHPDTEFSPWRIQIAARYSF